MSTSKLNIKAINVLSYIEQRFWETGNLPTDENVAGTLNITVEYVRSLWKNDTFKEAAQNRGINFDNERAKDVLDPKQVILANMLMNLHDKRSIREKLQELDIKTQQYNAWMRQPAFVEFLRKRAETLFKNSDPDAYMGLVKAVQSGDVNALKLFFEMRGIYNPKIQIDVNIEAMIVRVVEIVAKHVPNAQVLAAIADEIEGIMPGHRATKTSILPEVASNGNDEHLPTLNI